MVSELSGNKKTFDTCCTAANVESLINRPETGAATGPGAQRQYVDPVCTTTPLQQLQSISGKEPCQTIPDGHSSPMAAFRAYRYDSFWLRVTVSSLNPSGVHRDSRK